MTKGFKRSPLLVQAAPSALVARGGLLLCLARMIHEDSHQNAGSDACGSLPVISARSHALRRNPLFAPRSNPMVRGSWFALLLFMAGLRMGGLR